MMTRTVTPGTTPAHLVCEGALCSCTKAAVPSPVKVVSHNRYYIRGTSGIEKLVVTSKECDVRALQFYSCLASGKPEPCTAQLQWYVAEDQKRLLLANGAYPLPSGAVATCLSKGGQVRLLTHGQPPDGAAGTLPDTTSATPPNKAGEYQVTASSSKTGNIILPVVGDNQIHAPTGPDIATGDTSQLTASTETAPLLKCTHKIIRPGEPATFSLILPCNEPCSNVLWQETSETGANCTIIATTDATAIQRVFTRPGKYIVSATAGSQTAQHPITVSNNAVKVITAAEKPRAGILLTFSASETIFPVLTSAEKNKLRWLLQGPESTSTNGGQEFKHTFTHPGKYTLYAYFYDKNKEGKIQFEIKHAEVYSGKWIDGDGNIIRKAGYGQEICIYFEHTGLEGETVQLEVYAQHFSGTVAVLIRQIVLPVNKKVYYKFDTNEEIKKKIPRGWNGREAVLYFKIKPTGHLQIMQHQQAFPHSSADQLLLNEEIKVRKACFTDVNDRIAYSVISSKKEAALKIYATNLTGQELDIILLQMQGNKHLQQPLTMYAYADLLPLFKQDKVLSRSKHMVDRKGEVLVKADLSSLPATALVYAIIKLPGHNAVYTKTVWVYRPAEVHLNQHLQHRATAVIERVSLQRPDKACESLVWGAKVSCAFRMKVIDIAHKLQADPNHLMTCMAFETGGSFLPYLLSGHKAHNTPLPQDITDKQLDNCAVGLIQFTQIAVDHLNTIGANKISKRKLSHMTAEEQLDYVYLYLKEFRGRLNALEDFYLTILMPRAVGAKPDFVVFSRAEDERKKKKWYARNSGLDRNKDLVVTKKEVSVIIHTKYTEGLTYRNSCHSDCQLRPTDQPHDNSEWHHPTDNLQLRGWYNNWAPDKSKYGIIEERKSGKHQGLDFYSPVGSNVYACVKGIITASYYSASYGNVVILNGNYNGNNYYFMYAHLQQQSMFGTGKEVNAGTVIGYSGKTGNAAGMKPAQEHLHFEIRTKANVARGFDGRLDPLLIIKELNDFKILNPNQNNQIAKK